MDPKALMEMFNTQPRIGTLSTADGEGNVNSAVFGSPQMADERTVVMGIGNNRSFRYLKANPKAVFTVIEPGETTMEWKGCRVYLEAISMETEGELLDTIRKNIAEAAGEAAAKMVHAAIRFRISEIRNLIAPP